jgi:hypothetical protein
MGLPPLIAHAHVAGTHLILGVPIAWPNNIEPLDLVEQVVEVFAAICALILLRTAPR